MDLAFRLPSIILPSRPARRLPWPKGDELRAKGVEVTDVVKYHDWAKSIYFRDPNGLSLEYCCMVRNFTEQDAMKQESFTVPRAALELGNATSAAVTEAQSGRGRRRA